MEDVGELKHVGHEVESIVSSLVMAEVDAHGMLSAVTSDNSECNHASDLTICGVARDDASVEMGDSIAGNACVLEGVCTIGSDGVSEKGLPMLTGISTVTKEQTDIDDTSNVCVLDGNEHVPAVTECSIALHGNGSVEVADGDSTSPAFFQGVGSVTLNLNLNPKLDVNISMNHCGHDNEPDDVKKIESIKDEITERVDHGDAELGHLTKKFQLVGADVDVLDSTEESVCTVMEGDAVKENVRLERDCSEQLIVEEEIMVASPSDLTSAAVCRRSCVTNIYSLHHNDTDSQERIRDNAGSVSTASNDIELVDGASGGTRSITDSEIVRNSTESEDDTSASHPVDTNSKSHKNSEDVLEKALAHNCSVEASGIDAFAQDSSNTMECDQDVAEAVMADTIISEQSGDLDAEGGLHDGSSGINDNLHRENDCVETVPSGDNLTTVCCTEEPSSTANGGSEPLEDLEAVVAENEVDFAVSLHGSLADADQLGQEHAADLVQMDGVGAAASGEMAKDFKGQQSNQVVSRKANDKDVIKRNVWISGLHPRVRANELKAHCEAFGTVASAKIVTNTKLAKGGRVFGFVTMSTVNEAKRLIRDLHKTYFQKRLLFTSQKGPESFRHSSPSAGNKKTTGEKHGYRVVTVSERGGVGIKIVAKGHETSEDKERERRRWENLRHLREQQRRETIQHARERQERERRQQKERQRRRHEQELRQAHCEKERSRECTERLPEERHHEDFEREKQYKRREDKQRFREARPHRATSGGHGFTNLPSAWQRAHDHSRSPQGQDFGSSLQQHCSPLRQVSPPRRRPSRERPHSSSFRQRLQSPRRNRSPGGQRSSPVHHPHTSRRRLPSPYQQSKSTRQPDKEKEPHKSVADVLVRELVGQLAKDPSPSTEGSKTLIAALLTTLGAVKGDISSAGTVWESIDTKVKSEVPSRRDREHLEHDRRSRAYGKPLGDERHELYKSKHTREELSLQCHTQTTLQSPPHLRNRTNREEVARSSNRVLDGKDRVRAMHPELTNRERCGIDDWPTFHSSGPSAAEIIRDIRSGRLPLDADRVLNKERSQQADDQFPKERHHLSPQVEARLQEEHHPVPPMEAKFQEQDHPLVREESRFLEMCHPLVRKEAQFREESHPLVREEARFREEHRYLLRVEGRYPKERQADVPLRDYAPAYDHPVDRHQVSREFLFSRSQPPLRSATSPRMAESRDYGHHPLTTSRSSDYSQDHNHTAMLDRIAHPTHGHSPSSFSSAGLVELKSLTRGMASQEDAHCRAQETPYHQRRYPAGSHEFVERAPPLNHPPEHVYTSSHWDAHWSWPPTFLGRPLTDNQNSSPSFQHVESPESAFRRY